MPRPYKAATSIIATGAILGFVNLLLLGMVANIWGSGTLAAGFAVALMILPVFAYRHFVDGGKFPEQTFQDFAGIDESDVAAFWPLLQAVPPSPFGRPVWIDTAIPNSEPVRSRHSRNVPGGLSLTNALAWQQRPLNA